MQRMTRTHAITAGLAGVSMLAFWAVSANAQTPPTPPAPPKPAIEQPAVTAPGKTSTPMGRDAVNRDGMNHDAGMRSAATGDMMADKIQGLTVYTANPDAKGDARMAMPSADSAMKTITRDEYTRMTKGLAKVGEIDDLIVAADGRVKDAVVSVGGFLGVGERNVALGWSDLTFVRTAEGDTFAYIGKTKAELEKLPEFRPYK